ncbi:MAG: AMP-binding protein [Ilumatobacteraceae bacterium]
MVLRRAGRWSNRLARVLRTHGVGPDSVVAIRMERSLELIGAIVGVHKAGGAYLPVDPTYPPARQEFMLADSGARLVLTTSATPLTGVAAGVTVIELDGDWASEESTDPVEPLGDGDHLGYVIYTSGSTGRPKAVALPRRALANLMDWQLDRPDFEPARRTLQYSSPSFDVSYQEIASTLLSGGTLVLIDDLVRRDSRPARSPDRRTCRADLPPERRPPRDRRCGIEFGPGSRVAA